MGGYNLSLEINSYDPRFPPQKFAQDNCGSLALIPIWISIHMYSKLSNEFAHPFLNFNIATVEVWKCINNFIPRLIMDVITYPFWD